MRLILTILFFWYFTANATNYYVSNTGSDVANGISTATAWQTIAKVNVTATSGDSVFLKRGDTWNEQLRPSSSNIYFGAYGSGNKPLITGLQTVSLTNVGNIWSGIAANSVKNLNTVLVNGQIRAKGRYPNTGYLTVNSYTGDSIINTSLTGTPSYVGKEIVVRCASWVIDVTKVITQTTGILKVSPKLTYAGLGGNGYFFQNDSTFLDVQGEWSFDSATKKLCVYSTINPIVQISTIDTLVWLRQKNYITFDNISFQGANKAGFQLDTARHITIQNCSINYSGTLGISGGKSEYVSILNDSIQNSLSGAVYLLSVDPRNLMIDTCNYATITGNYIKNTSTLAGMGMSSDGRYIAVYVIGYKPVITYNRIDSSGYIGVIFNGDTSVVKNNFISNFDLIKDDGGGIYTVGNYVPDGYTNGSQIVSNIIMNGIGAPVGSNWTTAAPGVYLDVASKNIIMDSNSIYNCTSSAISLGVDSNKVRFNNIYNGTGVGLDYNGNANKIYNNAFYASSVSNANVYRRGGNSDIDSNYYSRPLNEYNNFQNITPFYNLLGWQYVIGLDTHSLGTPSFVTSDAALFVYNPTSSDSTIILSGTYISMRRVRYVISIVLHPFTSEILFKMVQLTGTTNKYKYYK